MERELATEIGERVQSWPLPIAYPGSRCVACVDEPAPYISWLFRWVGQSLRFTSLCLAGSYLQSGFVHADLTTAIRDGLRRPSLGHWRGFLRDALTRLPEGEGSPLVDAVRRFHAEVGVRRDVAGPPVYREGRVVRSSTTVIDAIISLRNDLEHGARGLDSERAAEVSAYLEDLCGRLLTALDELRGIELLARLDSGADVSLMGPDLPEEMGPHHSLLRCADGSEVALRPLALLHFLPEPEADGPPRRNDLLLYDGRKGKRLVFLGLTERWERGDVYEEFTAALEEKRSRAAEIDPLSSWSTERLREALVLWQWRAEAEGRCAAPPDLWIPRPAVEGRLADFLAGPQPAVLLTGPPGSGRSALLGQWMRTLWGEGEIPAVCLSAREVSVVLESARLSDTVPYLLGLTGTFEEMLDVGQRGGCATGLVLAVDEVESIGDPRAAIRLLEAVEALAAEHRARGLKLVVAVQSQAFARLLSSGLNLAEDLWMHSIVEAGDDAFAVPELAVEPLETDEAESLYEALRQAADTTAPHTPWALLSEHVRERLRSPVFAHRLLALARDDPIRGSDLAIDVDSTFLEGSLAGARYDPRRRRYVDAYPGRRRFVEAAARGCLLERRQSTPAQPIAKDVPESDYEAVVRSGLVQEDAAPPDYDALVLRFASRSGFAAAGASVLRKEPALYDGIASDPHLEELTRDVPGLEEALTMVLQRDLETPRGRCEAFVGRTTETALRWQILGAALLRFAEVAPTRVEEAFARLEAQLGADGLDSLFRAALDGAPARDRPDGAARIAGVAAGRARDLGAGTRLSVARALRRAGRNREAEHTLRDAAPDASPAQERRRLYVLGSLLRDTGRWADALPFLREAVDVASRAGDVNGELVARASLAEALSLLRQYDEALAEFERGEAIIGDADVEPRIRFRQKAAMALRIRGLLRKAYAQFKAVLEEATSARLLPLVGRARTELGLIHALLDDADGAVAHLREALSLKHQLGDTLGLKQAYLCLGYAHTVGGRKDDAARAFSQSLRYNRETSDVFGELLCLEFLTRMDPKSVERAELERAVSVARDHDGWGNPRIAEVLRRLEKVLGKGAHA